MLTIFKSVLKNLNFYSDFQKKKNFKKLNNKKKLKKKFNMLFK